MPADMYGYEGEFADTFPLSSDPNSRHHQQQQQHVINSLVRGLVETDHELQESERRARRAKRDGRSSVADRASDRSGTSSEYLTARGKDRTRERDRLKEKEKEREFEHEQEWERARLAQLREERTGGLIRSSPYNVGSSRGLLMHSDSRAKSPQATMGAGGHSHGSTDNLRSKSPLSSAAGVGLHSQARSGYSHSQSAVLTAGSTAGSAMGSATAGTIYPSTSSASLRAVSRPGPRSEASGATGSGGSTSAATGRTLRDPSPARSHGLSSSSGYIHRVGTGTSSSTAASSSRRNG